MKKVLIVLSSIFLVCSATICAEKKVYSGNEYGGQTEEFIVDPSEKDYEQFYKVVDYYNGTNQKVKTVYYLSEAIQAESGYCRQEETYSEGRLTEYKMVYSEEGAKIKGVTEVVEKVNSNNQVYEVWYSDGINTAATEATSFTLNYPLYSLSYVENEFEFDKAKKSENKNRYYFSAKYYLGRSFVQFKNKISKLNDQDKEIVKCFAEYMESPDMVDLYTAKAEVVSEGKTYTVYIQKGLLPYIQKNMKCFMAYGVMGVNEQLVLLMAEFSELQ